MRRSTPTLRSNRRQQTRPAKARRYSNSPGLPLTYPHNWSVKALAKMRFPGIGTILPPYDECGGWVGIGVQPKLATATTESVGLAPSHGRAVTTEAATTTNVQKFVIRRIAADGGMIIGIYSSTSQCLGDGSRGKREIVESGVGLGTNRISGDVGEHERLVSTVVGLE